MSQFDFGVIDPYVVDGVQLADDLNQFRDALLSYHRGGARPAYAQAGMLSINDSGGPNNWVLNVYLSPTIGDAPLFNYNTTTGAITVAAAAGGTLAAAILLAQAAASPSVQWNATGNPIDAKAWRATVNGAGALVLSSYSDAGVLQNSITFNRNGTVTAGASAGVMSLYAETVLSAANVDLRVAFPASWRMLKLEFLIQSNGGVDGGMQLGLTLAGTPVAATLFNSMTVYGQQSASVGTGFNPTGPAWVMSGLGAWFRGTLRYNKSSGGLFYGTGQYWVIGQGGTRYLYSCGHDQNGVTAADGFRFFNSGGVPLLAANSFARCAVML